MKHSAGLRFLLACGASVLATGCATTVHRQYPDENVKKADVATIILQHPPIETSKLDGSAPKVDRKRLRNQSLLYGGLWFPLTFGWPGIVHWAMNSNPRIVEVLPGEHSIEVWFSQQVGPRIQTGNTIRYTMMKSKYPKTLHLVAQAGRKYRVNGRLEGSDWSACVEDITDETIRVATSEPARNDRSAFEQELQKAMSSGAVSSDAITLTYPDGSQTTISGAKK